MNEDGKAFGLVGSFIVDSKLFLEGIKLARPETRADLPIPGNRVSDPLTVQLGLN